MVKMALKGPGFAVQTRISELHYWVGQEPIPSFPLLFAPNHWRPGLYIAMSSTAMEE